MANIVKTYIEKGQRQELTFRPGLLRHCYSAVMHAEEHGNRDHYSFPSIHSVNCK